MRKKFDKTAKPRRKRKQQTWVISGDTIYWILADIMNVDTDAADYACFDSTVELWIKARRKDTATTLAKRWLAEIEWKFKKRFLIVKVAPGYAVLGSMLDPPHFSPEEADQWSEHFRVADRDGLDYDIGHYYKSKRKRK